LGFGEERGGGGAQARATEVLVDELQQLGVAVQVGFENHFWNFL
jgi:hypothetical protein